MIVCVCVFCKSSALKYSYPPNIDESKKKEFVDFFKKGYKLYGQNCSKCHGVKYSSTDGGNQFTEGQIRNYAVNIKIRNETHKFTREMNKDDIDAICVFLKYRQQ